MNSDIEKNYSIKILKLSQDGDSYKITTNNNDYKFVKVKKEEITLIMSNINDKTRYKIKKTIYNNYYTQINKEYYILVELDNRTYINYREIMKESLIIYNKNTLDSGIRWQIKNDYIEDYLNNTNNKIIEETKDYYLGLAEQAIVTYKNSNNIYDYKVLCHKRIENNNFRMPDNIVIDYKERDIAEYIKYLIFIESLDDKKIIKIIDENVINNYNLNLIISRLLYPSEYFDLIDYSKSGIDMENEIIKLVNKEKTRQKIINYINKKKG